MPSLHRSIEIFCSYAHENEAHLQKLETHLSMLKRQGLIATWHDHQITAGTEWAQAIDIHLNKASVILLLISPDFFASDYCYGIEMTRALQRHKDNEARVIPILLRPVDWQGAPFAHLQALPTNAKPITSWGNRDEAWTSVTVGIRRAIEDLAQLSANPSRHKMPVSKPQDAGKYQVSNDGPVQGQVIGDHNKVELHFHSPQDKATSPPSPVLPSVQQQDHAFNYHSCILSYATEDQSFAEKLHADLTQQGVSYWFAPHDLKMGDKLRDKIYEAIQRQDKLLIVLSENAIGSAWVEEEVDAALDREHQHQGTFLLFPIRLDDQVLQTSKAWAVAVRQRYIGDFRQWTDDAMYQRALQRLLRDLKA